MELGADEAAPSLNIVVACGVSRLCCTCLYLLQTLHLNIIHAIALWSRHLLQSDLLGRLVYRQRWWPELVQASFPYNFPPNNRFRSFSRPRK
jgi:hypothetical protein